MESGPVIMSHQAMLTYSDVSLHPLQVSNARGKATVHPPKDYNRGYNHRHHRGHRPHDEHLSRPHAPCTQCIKQARHWHDVGLPAVQGRLEREGVGACTSGCVTTVPAANLDAVLPRTLHTIDTSTPTA
jgi:hypothetical protein